MNNVAVIMASLEQKFDDACALVKSFTSRPTNDDMLGLYALYKQAKLGDCTGSRPFLFPATSKYDAWAALQGMSREEAMNRYVRFAKYLAKTYASDNSA